MSARYDFDLVCIGSGPAGQRGAVQAAKLGERAAVVERRRRVGGVCIDTGTIPRKTLREAGVTFDGLAGKGDRPPRARVGSRPTCVRPRHAAPVTDTAALRLPTRMPLA